MKRMRASWLLKARGPLNLDHHLPPPPGSHPFGGQPGQCLPPAPSSTCSFLAESAFLDQARPDSEQGWAWSLQDPPKDLDRVAGPQACPRLHSGPPPTPTSPLAATILTTFPLLPSCPCGASSQAAGVGGGERCLIPAGERHRELKIQFYSKAPPLPGGPEGLIGGRLAGTHKDPNIPVNMCSLGTQPAFRSFFLPSFLQPHLHNLPSSFVPPSLPCPSHRNSSSSRNLSLHSTLFPEGVPSSPSVLLHECNLLPLSILGYSSPLLSCDLPQRQEYKSRHSLYLRHSGGTALPSSHFQSTFL